MGPDAANDEGSGPASMPVVWWMGVYAQKIVNSSSKSSNRSGPAVQLSIPPATSSGFYWLLDKESRGGGVPADGDWPKTTSTGFRSRGRLDFGWTDLSAGCAGPDGPVYAGAGVGRPSKGG